MVGFTRDRVGAVVVAVVAVSVAAAQTDVLFVDGNNCPGPGDGSELDPYCSIQTGIDNAEDTDEIVVAPGAYFETINFLGKAITLRSSDGREVTVIDGTGFFHVVQCASGEGPDTVLDGFTITGGNADGDDFSDLVGGGMFNDNSSPTVIDCTFSGNNAGVGGGIFNDNNSNLTVTNCRFEGNTALNGGGMFSFGGSQTVTNCTFIENVGGGMFNSNFSDDGSPTVTNCMFIGNTASFGGGMHNFASSPTVSNCTFTENISAGGGGGMVNSYYFNNSPTVTNCTFIGNTGSFGGAIFNDNSSLTLTKCTFSGNSASGSGGAMFGDGGNPTVIDCTFIANSAGLNGGGMSGGSPTVTNCVFIENMASNAGGGMSNSNDPTLTNCMFSGNSAAVGGGMYHSYGNPTVNNSILWGNSPDEIVDAAGAVTTVHYSDVQGGFPGIGNIDADPLFVDPVNGNLRLSPGSPCIDAGDNTAVPEDITTDLDGNPRFVDDPDTPDSGNGDPPVVDMGAYEFQVPCPWDLDGDGDVFVSDVLVLLMDFGSCDGSPADFDGDGCVTVVDLLTLLGNWGPCPDSRCPWDVNGDGTVDQTDLQQVLGNLGPCDGCPEDVNGDGVVNGQDAAAVATHFGPCP